MHKKHPRLHVAITNWEAWDSYRDHCQWHYWVGKELLKIVIKEKIQAEENTPREDQSLAKSGPNILSSESF